MPLAVYILGLAIFSIGTAELMVAGMTATLSQAFGISVGDVGHLISYYAFGVMFGGPVLTYFFLKYKGTIFNCIDKEKILCMHIMSAFLQKIQQP